MNAASLAFGGGVLASFAARDLVDGLGTGMARVRGQLHSAADVFNRAGREGVDPAAGDRRRFLVAGALLAFAGGGFVCVVLAGIAASAIAPTVGSRILRARRERSRSAVDAGWAEI